MQVFPLVKNRFLVSFGQPDCCLCFVVAITITLFVHPGPHIWDAQQSILYTLCSL